MKLSLSYTASRIVDNVFWGWLASAHGPLVSIGLPSRNW